jgi:hypothetical protein
VNNNKENTSLGTKACISSVVESNIKLKEQFILKTVDNNLNENDCNKTEKNNYASKIPSSDKFIKSKLSTSELEMNHGGECLIGSLN